MTKKEARLILLTLFIMQLVWITGLGIIGDFYPQLETIKQILTLKSFFNGGACFLGLFIYALNSEDLK